MILAAGGVLMEHNVLTAIDGAHALRELRESGKLAEVEAEIASWSRP